MSAQDSHGRAEDAVLAALDDDAAVLSRIAGCVRVIAAHQPRVEIRRELRKILEAIDEARAVRSTGRAAYAAKRR